MGNDPLAVVIATALQAGRALDEERVREIVREELKNLQACAPASDWTTPPKGAQIEGVSLKRVRALIAAGVVETRPKGSGQNAKYEIRLSSLRAALAGPAQPPKPVDAAGWAAARAVKRGAA